MTSSVAQNIWLFSAATPIHSAFVQAARARQAQLTKPAGSLGQLEVIAERFAGWQGRVDPLLEAICVRVFAGDHGVCAKGVSAFPQVVTTQMMANFVAGGAAISVLSRQIGADLSICNLGTVHPAPALPGLQDCSVAPGTRDFSEEPAMTAAELAQALSVGANAVPDVPLHLFIGGEMGIGNTTSAAALFSALLQLPAAATVGPGTGVDGAGLARKRAVVEQALNLHSSAIDAAEVPAVEALRRLGGLEIAALVGAYIYCAQRAVPVLVDGYISTAAALCAVLLNPGVRDWLMFAHVSAEPAHRLALEYLDAKPLLDLRMRLGEGSGAAVAVPLLRTALTLHNGMATFAAAGVASGPAA